MKRKIAPALVAASIFFVPIAIPVVRAATPSGSLEGTWSVPSLSQRDVPMVFTLLPGGKATEKVGTYHGEGAWKNEGDSIRIIWSSEWIGLLRPAAKGAYELLTWKKGTPLDGPPDDIQLAKRIS